MTDNTKAEEQLITNQSVIKDAIRYRWLKAQRSLQLSSERMRGTPWTNIETGKRYYPSHFLAVNGTGYPGIEHLDDAIDMAMGNYSLEGDESVQGQVLLQPIPLSERKPEPDDMDGTLVWCGSKAPGLPYWEWCLDDIHGFCSSGYTHWLPANVQFLPARVEG